MNPEVAHEHMAGLNFFHVVAQAIEAGKLFHIDLNDQKPGRFDQDLRFASESIKPLFFLVKLLEESGYDGPRHFDAHAYRTEDEEGVWDFARGCMRTYLILKEKAQQFCQHAGIQALLAEIRDAGDAVDVGPYTRERGRRAEGADLRSRRAGARGGCRTNASISWSSNCCSECRPFGALPGTRLEHTEPHGRRHRGRRRPPASSSSRRRCASTRSCRSTARGTACCRIADPPSASRRR